MIVLKLIIDEYHESRYEITSPGSYFSVGQRSTFPGVPTRETEEATEETLNPTAIAAIAMRAIFVCSFGSTKPHKELL